MMEPQAMMPIPPETPITATLQAQEWNLVIGILSDAPYKVVANIINRLGQQLQAGATQAAAPEHPKPNGVDQPAV